MHDDELHEMGDEAVNTGESEEETEEEDLAAFADEELEEDEAL